MDAEWQLNPIIFSQIVSMLKFTPEIDLFATRLNNQVTRFYSWQPDPDALAINAFAQQWHENFMYAFPPFSMISRVLQKIEQERTERVLMILPMWPTQNWWPGALGMLVRAPYLLPRKCIFLPQNPGETFPLKKIQMVAMCLSGNHTRTRDFRTGLSKSLPHHGGMALTTNIGRISNGFVSFRSLGDVITFAPL